RRRRGSRTRCSTSRSSRASTGIARATRNACAATFRTCALCRIAASPGSNESFSLEFGHQLEHIPLDELDGCVVLVGEDGCDSGHGTLAVAQFPHSRAYLVEREVRAAVEIQEHRLIGRALHEYAIASKRATRQQNQSAPRPKAQKLNRVSERSSPSLRNTGFV